MKTKKNSMFLGKKPDERMKALVRAAGHEDVAVATAAARDLSMAMTLPLQQGVLNGDIFSVLYTAVEFEYGVSVEFPLDLLAPGTEQNFKAYVIPRTGALPEKSVESDYVMVPTFEVGHFIDFSMRYLKETRWDILGRVLQILEAGFIRKFNTDAWRTALVAAKNRNLLVYDDAATAGLFTKRLVTLMKDYMRRNAGGNSTSTNRGKLTDIFVSPEASSDMMSWNLSEIPDAIRTKIMIEGRLKQIDDVTIHDIDELGVGQEFENYLANTLGLSHTNSKVEFVVGADVDNGKQDAFIMPYRQMPTLYEDMTLARQRRVGVGGTAEVGWVNLDNRRLLLGQL